MEEREIFSSGHAVKVNVGPEGFHVAQNSMQIPGPTVSPVPAPARATAGNTEGKKKRGRPRKYESAGRAALSPVPISVLVPLTGDYSSLKRGGGKPFESNMKSFKFDFGGARPGNKRDQYMVGSNFTPHVINVDSGEDITVRIMSFNQDGHHAICVLSANGPISNATVCQPASAGGTRTYEGIFELISLCGSFSPDENGLADCRTGGLSVSLAGADGQIVGGGLAGLLVAAGPVQVVLGSFIVEQNPKKQRVENASTSAPPHANPPSAEEMNDVSTFGGMKPIMTPSGFQIDNNNNNIAPPSLNNGQGSSRRITPPTI